MEPTGHPDRPSGLDSLAQGLLGTLDEAMLPAEPMDLFEAWMADVSGRACLSRLRWCCPPCRPTSGRVAGWCC